MSSPHPPSRYRVLPPSLPAAATAFAHSVHNAVRLTVFHVRKHAGVGIVCAVAYFDPGNWSVDLQAGASFGYRPMLFVVLMAGLGAIVLQTLACKLGTVTGLDLASHCRLFLHDHPKHPRLLRYLVLYPLYVLCEIAIISTDLAELLGSAIGLCLLFPKLELWAAVILTAFDVLVFLAFSDPSWGDGRPVRLFEYVVTCLVFAVFACFLVLIVKVNPYWPNVFLGYLPSKDLFKSEPDAVYSAVGILGATVMPHALFLGSSLSTQDRVSTPSPRAQPEMPGVSPARRGVAARAKRYTAQLFRISKAERAASPKDYRTKYGDRENNSLAFIRQHLGHGTVDVVVSLLTLAVPINSAILILAATVFYIGEETAEQSSVGLFEAHDLIRNKVGNAAGLVFALALVCAGQTASITATLAGQIVSEGFIEWRISPFLRRLITRLISLVPSVSVAAAVGRNGISTLLVASQVALSVVLPFIAFPLIYLTSSEVVMRVRKPPAVHPTNHDDEKSVDEKQEEQMTRMSSKEVSAEEVMVADPEVMAGEIYATARTPRRSIDQSMARKAEISSDVVPEFVDFSNGRILCCLSYAIWCVVLVANVYAIVMLVVQKEPANEARHP